MFRIQRAFYEHLSRIHDKGKTGARFRKTFVRQEKFKQLMKISFLRKHVF